MKLNADEADTDLFVSDALWWMTASALCYFTFLNIYSFFCISTLSSFDQTPSWPLTCRHFKSSVADGFKPRHEMTTFASLSMYCIDTHTLSNTLFFLYWKKKTYSMRHGLYWKLPEITPSIYRLFWHTQRSKCAVLSSLRTHCGTEMLLMAHH